jgi:hypothetical protein
MGVWVVGGVGGWVGVGVCVGVGVGVGVGRYTGFEYDLVYTIGIIGDNIHSPDVFLMCS